MKMWCLTCCHSKHVIIITYDFKLGAEALHFSVLAFGYPQLTYGTLPLQLCFVQVKKLYPNFTFATMLRPCEEASPLQNGTCLHPWKMGLHFCNCISPHVKRLHPWKIRLRLCNYISPMWWGSIPTKWIPLSTHYLNTWASSIIKVHTLFKIYV